MAAVERYLPENSVRPLTDAGIFAIFQSTAVVTESNACVDYKTTCRQVPLLDIVVILRGLKINHVVLMMIIRHLLPQHLQNERLVDSGDLT